MLLVSSNQMHTYTYVLARPQCSRPFSESKLQLNALSRGFRWFSGAHSSDFRSSVTAQRKVHELVNHDSAVGLFPSLHSSGSFIKKSYQLHQSTVLNNRPCVPRSREHRKRPSSTWLCVPNPHETSADRLIQMYRANGFILFILSLFRSSGLSIYLCLNGPSAYVQLTIHLARSAATHTTLCWFIAMHMEEHVHMTAGCPPQKHQRQMKRYFQTCVCVCVFTVCVARTVHSVTLAGLFSINLPQSNLGDVIQCTLNK